MQIQTGRQGDLMGKFAAFPAIRRVMDLKELRGCIVTNDAT